MKLVELAPPARAELDEAADWYERERPVAVFGCTQPSNAPYG